MAHNPFKDIVDCPVPHCEAVYCDLSRKRVCALLYYYLLEKDESLKELEDERLSEQSKEIFQKIKKK